MAVLIQSGTTTANSVTTVTFTTYYPRVEILNRGTDDLWIRTDGTVPTIGGDECYVIPQYSWKDDIPNTGVTGTTVVYLLSASAIAFTVEGLNF